MKYNSRDLDNFIKYSDFKCRFSNSRFTIIVPGTFTHSPSVVAVDNFADFPPNAVYCKTPIWPIDESVESESVKLDISVNG